jgi:hypothetical protein
VKQLPKVYQLIWARERGKHYHFWLLTWGVGWNAVLVFN